jgi:ATP-dependent helicase HepA
MPDAFSLDREQLMSQPETGPGLDQQRLIDIWGERRVGWEQLLKSLGLPTNVGIVRTMTLGEAKAFAARLHIFQPGDFVRARANDLGIGKIARIISQEEVEVHYFQNIARIEPVRVRATDLVRVEPLPQQARCYIRGPDGRWILGRINRRHGQRDNEYEIWLPDGKERSYPITGEFWVRCDTPPDDPVLDDPTDVLVAGGLDDLNYHACRHPFAVSLIEQRATCRHMHGLLSSRIRILPHQLEVVRRVLEDPIQRYLLADEVGLGKTIEAGAILRQFLLDEPDGSVLVLVPRLLIDQWEEELRERFLRGSEYPADRIILRDIEEVEELKDKRFGLVVVDEAQHPAGWAFAEDPEYKRRFEVLGELCGVPARVLLLSATPARNHERDFLAMLHLLDPALYPLSAREAFTARVRQRQAVGSLLLGLQEGAGAFVLGQLQGTLRTLAEQFPQDQRLHALTEELSEALRAGRDRPERVDLVHRIRLHVSETYRLHRRLLRNRRSEVPREDLASRAADGQQPGPRTLLADLDERLPRLVGWLEDWRVEARGSLRSDREDNPLFPSNQERELAAVFRLLVQGAGSSPGVLLRLAHSRLRRELTPPLQHDLTDAESKGLLTPLFPGEESLLRQLLQDARSHPTPEGSRRPPDRIRQLLRRLKRLRRDTPPGCSPPRCVVFTAYAASADALQRRLRRGLGAVAVESYRRGLTPPEAAMAIRRFRTEPPCFVLVCDGAAEEGRNLQFADYLVHFDLPLAPNRIEQRIGRLDRLGRTTAFHSWIFLGPRLKVRTPWRAWYQVLDRAFRIFETSIASLQFFVDDRMPDLALALFRHGAGGLVEQVEQLRNDVEDELTQLTEQDLIDSVDAMDTDAVAFREGLLEQERRHEQARAALERWVKQLAFAIDQDEAGLVRYTPQFSKTDHARLIWWYYRTHIPLDWIMRRFVDPNWSFPAVKYRPEEARGILNRFRHATARGTFSREQVLRTPGAWLYRLGNRLVEALNEFMHWDDRGRVFALWRRHRNRREANWVGFRFDYIVSADTSAARPEFERYGRPEASLPALQRRADALLPPLVESVFIDRHGKAVTDSALLEVLTPLYRSGPFDDFDLTDRNHRAVLGHWLGGEYWEDICHRAREASERELMNRGDTPLRQRCAEMAERADRLLAGRVEQLELRRVEGLLGGVQAEDVELERALRQILVEGMRKPRLRLDSLGLIIVSQRAPE